jgi:hypothetical protein
LFTQTETKETIQDYIHNLQQLRQAMLKTGLPEVAAAIEKSLQVAREYLEFLETSQMELFSEKIKRR